MCADQASATAKFTAVRRQKVLRSIRYKLAHGTEDSMKAARRQKLMYISCGSQGKRVLLARWDAQDKAKQQQEHASFCQEPLAVLLARFEKQQSLKCTSIAQNTSVLVSPNAVITTSDWISRFLCKPALRQ